VDVGGTRPIGERKKSRDQDLGVLPGVFFDPFWRSWRTRVCWRVRLEEGEGVRRECGRGTMDASGRFIISRSSFIVKAASNGPRRPMIDTCFTVEVANTSRTL